MKKRRKNWLSFFSSDSRDWFFNSLLILRRSFCWGTFFISSLMDLRFSYCFWFWSSFFDAGLRFFSHFQYWSSFFFLCGSPIFLLFWILMFIFLMWVSPTFLIFYNIRVVCLFHPLEVVVLSLSISLLSDWVRESKSMAWSLGNLVGACHSSLFEYRVSGSCQER